jgi:hypothetical protein
MRKQRDELGAPGGCPFADQSDRRYGAMLQDQQTHETVASDRTHWNNQRPLDRQVLPKIQFFKGI